MAASGSRSHLAGKRENASAAASIGEPLLVRGVACAATASNRRLRSNCARPNHPASRVQAARESSAASALRPIAARSEEHTSELQSLRHIVCRLLLEKKNKSRGARGL